MPNTRWFCPQCGDTRLAPRKARRDDTRTFCLTCSAKSPRIVRRERVLTVAERLSAEASARRQAYKAAKRRMLKSGIATQADFPSRFSCGWSGAESVARRAFNPSPIIEVKRAAKPRKPRVTASRVIFYDAGCTETVAKAAVAVGVAVWGLQHCLRGPTSPRTGEGRELVRQHIRRIIGLDESTPIAIKPSLAGLIDTVEDLIVRQAAGDYLSSLHGSPGDGFRAHE